VEVSEILQQKSTLRKHVIAKRDKIDEGVRVGKSHLICDQLLDLLDTNADTNGCKDTDVAGAMTPAVVVGSSNAATDLPAAVAGLSACPLKIAVYQAMGSEVDLQDFILAAYKTGMRICFPCMTEASFDVAKPWLKGRRMLFYEVSEEDYRNKQAAFLRNPLEICSADDVMNQGFLQVPPESIDMVVVPVVAFDGDNYRLGYGGGNYDGFLSLVYALNNDVFLSRETATSETRERPVIVAGAAFIEQEVDCVPHEEHDLRLPLIITA